MCGRFTQAQIAELDREVFKLLSVPRLPPRYNVAPTQDVAVVREGGRGKGRSVDLVRWGLIPAWAKDPTIGSRLINARAETLAVKPAFESAFRYRRCLIPSDGFYEWEKTPRGKQPHYIRMRDGRVFAYAGLWERWEDPGHDPIETCTIITTDANELVAPIHDRMPAIVRPERYDEWLDPAHRDPRSLRPLLTAYPAEEMASHPVSTYVNRPEHDGPACIEPIQV